MNILHINNYANVSTELRNAQIALGHNSRIVQLNKSALLFNFSGEDYKNYGGIWNDMRTFV